MEQSTAYRAPPAEEVGRRESANSHQSTSSDTQSAVMQHPHSSNAGEVQWSSNVSVAPQRQRITNWITDLVNMVNHYDRVEQERPQMMQHMEEIRHKAQHNENFFRSQIEQLNTELQRERNSNAHLGRTVADQLGEVQSLKGKNAKLETQVIEKQRFADGLRKELDTRRGEKQALEDQLSQTQASLKDGNDKSQDLQRDLNEERELRKKAEAEKEEAETQVKDLTTDLDLAQRRSTCLQEQLESSNQVNVELDARYLGLKNDLDHAYNNLNNEFRESSERRAQCKQLTKYKDDLEHQTDKLKDDLATATARFNEVDKGRSNAQASSAKFEKEFQDERARIDDCSNRLQEVEAEKSKLIERVSQYRAEVNSSEQVAKASKEKCQKLQHSIDFLVNRLELMSTLRGQDKTRLLSLRGATRFLATLGARRLQVLRSKDTEIDELEQKRVEVADAARVIVEVTSAYRISSRTPTPALSQLQQLSERISAVKENETQDGDRTFGTDHHGRSHQLYGPSNTAHRKIVTTGPNENVNPPVARADCVEQIKSVLTPSDGRPKRSELANRTPITPSRSSITKESQSGSPVSVSSTIDTIWGTASKAKSIACPASLGNELPSEATARTHTSSSELSNQPHRPQDPRKRSTQHSQPESPRHMVGTKRKRSSQDINPRNNAPSGPRFPDSYRPFRKE